MDVAAVLEGLLTHPVYAARIARAAGQALTREERRWLAAFAFLHDAGKLSPRFQAKAWNDAAQMATAGHLVEGAIWADRLLGGVAGPLMDGAAEPLIEPLLNAGGTVADDWFRVLLAHHGRPFEVSRGSMPSDSRTVFLDVPGYDWCVEDRRIGEALRQWFPKVAIAPDLLRRAPLVHLFAGLLALADWIGSDEAAFPHSLDFDVDYAARARKRATAALRAIGLQDSPWPTVAPSFAELTGHDVPRGVQAATDAVPLDARLAIIEAETGAGKTEAALARFAALRSAGLVDGLYFAVPTRAAASQLHRRVDEAMARIGGSNAVLAVPGMLRAGTATGQRLPGFQVLWDDDRRHWAAEHPTRYLAAPVAVGTIDQALMASLQVKHAPLRAAALSRSLLVIDEVHASDAYMNAIARPLVRAHTELGGHALLMSATLGSAQRARWLGRNAPDRAEAEVTPYPAIWHSRSSDEPIRPTGGDRMKVVWPVVVPTMDAMEAARCAVEAADHGARVLVIRNTVDVAVATWEAVVASRPDLCLTLEGRPALHHSRFAAEDRLALDGAVEAALDPRSASGGVVVVGTQTLEQSLDIDADLLITDLCPMDVLLQRIGRLHRHAKRCRPGGFEEARVEVLVPKGGLARLAEGPGFENGLGAWKAVGGYAGIYIDLRVIELTRRLVAAGGPWTIPNDNRNLVEGATHADATTAVEKELGWADYGMHVDAKGLAEGGAGAILVLDRGKPFPRAFPDAEEAVQTRLGARGPSFALPHGTRGPFGYLITTVAPPAHWCAGLSGDEPVAVEGDATGLRLAIGDRAFHYGTCGLMRA